MEKWKPIKNYEGYYEVSNLGRVRSFKGWNGREYYSRKTPLYLKPYSKPQGYQYISISNPEKHIKNKRAYIHRLVAEAFCSKEGYEDYNGTLTVNHMDFNKSNNNADNLEWCTYKENLLHFRNSNRYDGVEKRRVETIRDKYQTELSYHAEHIVYLYKHTDLNINEISKLINIGKDRVGRVLKEAGML